MRTFIVRRLLGAIPLVLGIATIIFFVVNLAPGDPTNRFLNPNMSQEAQEQIRVNLGLDQPIHIRYVRWLGALAQGDLGFSFTRNRPVLDIIKEILPNTLILSVTAIGVAFVIGILLGVLQAVRQYSLVDSVASVVGLFFYSGSTACRRPSGSRRRGTGSTTRSASCESRPRARSPRSQPTSRRRSTGARSTARSRSSAKPNAPLLTDPNRT